MSRFQNFDLIINIYEPGLLEIMIEKKDIEKGASTDNSTTSAAVNINTETDYRMITLIAIMIVTASLIGIYSYKVLNPYKHKASA